MIGTAACEYVLNIMEIAPGKRSMEYSSRQALLCGIHSDES